MIARIFTFAFASIGSLVFALFAFDAETAENAFVTLGYGHIAVLSGASAFVILNGKNSSIVDWARVPQNRLLALACAAAALFLYTREGGNFKVAFDEHVLTNVSMNLHERHLPVISESPLIDYSRIELIDKRPLLFPFLLSLVHDATGYRSSNGFYLNLVLTALFLLLFALVVERLASRRAAYLAIALAACTPLLAHSASGSGFEILNLCCLMLTLWLGMEYWENPGASELARLAFASVLASHVRYESILVAIPIGAFALGAWIRTKRLEIPWSVCTVPLFFIPLVWQQRAVAESPGRFQYEVAGDKLFSLDHLSENLDSAFRFFFIPDNLYAGSPFIGFVGAAGLLGLLAFSLTRRKKLYGQKPARVAAAIFSLYLLALTSMLATFYYGKFDNVILSRLALPIVVTFIIGGTFLLAKAQRGGLPARLASYLFIACTALFAAKQYANPLYNETNALQTRIDWALDFADGLPPGKHLFISTMPVVFEIQQLNTIHTSRAKASLDKLEQQMALKTYREIFVVQNFMLESVDGELVAAPLPHNDLGPAVQLEMVSEVSFAPYNFSRISRIAAIDLTQSTLPESSSSEKKSPIRSTQFKTPSPSELEMWHKALP